MAIEHQRNRDKKMDKERREETVGIVGESEEKGLGGVEGGGHKILMESPRQKYESSSCF